MKSVVRSGGGWSWWGCDVRDGVGGQMDGSFGRGGGDGHVVAGEWGERVDLKSRYHEMRRVKVLRVGSKSRDGDMRREKVSKSCHLYESSGGDRSYRSGLGECHIREERCCSWEVDSWGVGSGVCERHVCGCGVEFIRGFGPGAHGRNVVGPTQEFEHCIERV